MTQLYTAQTPDSLSLRAYSKGEFLIRQGDAPGPAYMLVSGAVEVVRDGEVLCDYDLPGSIFGEVGVLLGQPSMVGFRAMEETEVRVVEDLQGYIGQDPEALWGLSISLAERLAAMDKTYFETRATMTKLLAETPTDNEPQRKTKHQINEAWEAFNEFMRQPIF